MSRFGQWVFVYSFLAVAAFGQSFSSLNGSVQDPAGAVVPNAKVELVNGKTGVKRATVAGNSGLYSFSQVVPGTYQLSVTAPGFAVQHIENLELLVNTPSTVIVKMEIGSVSETVQVEAEAAQVNTTDASLGNAINNTAIVQLPFEARNPAQLLALQPGVTFLGSTDSASPGRLNGAVNGSKPDQNNITLDGMDVNNHNTRDPLASVLRVTLDSVQEFRTTTQNSSADQGRGAGAEIALVTKSGTNGYHGSLYEYHRNTITSANDFFSNRSGVERKKLIRNLFGASIGAPIKKDRLFYFLNYEGRRDATDAIATRIVPTASFRQGIIQYLNNSGGVSTMTPATLKAIDPAGLGVNPNVLAALNQYPLPNDDQEGDGYNTSGYRFKASTPLRQNTYIAKLDYTVDSAAKNTVYWRGNLQNDNSSGLPQFPGQGAASIALDNSKGYSAGWSSILGPTAVSTFRYGYTRYGHESTTIQSQPYVSFRGLDTLQATTTIDGNSAGVARIIPVHQFTEDFSWTKGHHDVRFGGVARIIRNNSSNLSTAYPNGEVTYSYLAGTGASLRPDDLNSNFSTPFRTAAVNLLGPVSYGDVIYHYGLDGSVQPFGQPVKRRYGAEEYEFYVTDTWRLAKAFTVTAGLRYSLAPAIREVNGLQVSPTVDLGDWFAQRGNLAAAGQSQALAGPISFDLSSNNGQPLYQTPKTNFSPRIAIAYSPQANDGPSKWLFGGPGKTSIRAGFGMFYDLFGMSLMRNFDSNAPGLNTEFQTPASANLATQPRFTGYSSLPSSVIPTAPPGGFPYTPPDGFTIANSIDQHLKQPYTMTFNFSLGREFGHGFYVQAAYVGRLARRSLVVTDLAQPTNLRDPKSGQTYWDAINYLAAAARNNVPLSQIKSQPFFEHFYPTFANGYSNATQGMYDQEMQYYPTDITSGLLDIDEVCAVDCGSLGPNSMFNAQYASLFAYRSIGKGNYNALQLTVRKRLTSGLTFDFNYTWAKSIDLTSSAESDFGKSSYAVLLNPYAAALNRSVSDYDIRHSFSGWAVYELPFGKNKKFANTANGFVNAFIGGWQLGGLWNITSGLPRSVSNSGSWPTNWNYSGFATAISTPPNSVNAKNVAGIDGSAGPNIFADPQVARDAFDYSYAGAVGSRNVIRGDGLMSIDMSLAKRFVMPWKESHTMQFRWEVFNVPNAVRFDVNDASLDVASTGTFGKYSTVLTPARVMQFGLRYEF